jgi:hypothetical protein
MEKTASMRSFITRMFHHILLHGQINEDDIGRACSMNGRDKRCIQAKSIDNLQNLIYETSRTFRNKKREYMKGKINHLETNNKNKNIRDLYRGINEFKKGYQPRINIIKDENGNLLADLQNVLNRWKNFFNQVLNVPGVHDVRQMDMHTAEPLVPEPSLVEVEIAIGKLKS